MVVNQAVSYFGLMGVQDLSVNGHLKDACFTKPNVQDRCNSHSDKHNMGFETHAHMHRLATKKPGIGLNHTKQK